MTALKRVLPFAKEFGWTDGESVDDERTTITHLHSRNELEIPVCNCRRCMRFKLRQKVAALEERSGVPATPDERTRLNNEVNIETDRARAAAQRRGRYL